MSDWFTDEQVEKAAEAIFKASVISFCEWKDLDEDLAQDVQIKARAALRAVNPYEWVPIEMAPKDATVNISVKRRDGRPIFRNKMAETFPAYIDQEGRICNVETWKPDPGLNGEHFVTTHYMLLPPSPQEGK